MNPDFLDQIILLIIALKLSWSAYKNQSSFRNSVFKIKDQWTNLVLFGLGFPHYLENYFFYWGKVKNYATFNYANNSN